MDGANGLQRPYELIVAVCHESPCTDALWRSVCFCVWAQM
jgi:hypothetical protein